MLEIKKTVENGKVTVSVEGRLDTTTAPDLEDVLKDNLIDENEIVLDFEKLEYISSAGLRVLLATQKAMGQTGSLKVINVNEDVMDILNVTGFSEILTIE